MITDYNSLKKMHPCAGYSISIPAMPHAIPSKTTDETTNHMTFLGNERLTMRREGRLMAGKVRSSAAAGPAPRPAAMKA